MEVEIGDKWSLNQEEEDLHRKNLFRKARKCDEKAKQELQEVYGVRLWSEKERPTSNTVNGKGKKTKPSRDTSGLKDSSHQQGTSNKGSTDSRDARDEKEASSGSHKTDYMNSKQAGKGDFPHGGTANFELALPRGR